MEQPTNSDLFTTTDIKIDDDARRHITSLASWAMVIVITAVIGYIITIIGLFSAPKTPAVANEGFVSALQTGDSVAFTVVALIVGLLINYFLYQFASNSRKSLASLNSSQLAAGFRSLKIYFLITTIIIIIVFCFVMIATLVAL